MSRKAFTLLELLSVIAIISLLVGILTPVLASARRAGQKTVCLSNLRSIGVAALSYLNSNGFPPYFRDAITLEDADYSYSWSDFLVKGNHLSVEVPLDAIPEANGDGGIEGTYLAGMVSQRAKIFQCPSQVQRLIGTINGVEVTYRADYIALGHEQSLPVAGIYTSPAHYGDSRLIWLGEAFTTHGAIGSDEYVRQTQTHNDTNDVNPLRHDGASTYLFGDSHAESSKVYHLADWRRLSYPWEPSP